MIVVDTHIVIWDALRPEMLSGAAKHAISEANKEMRLWMNWPERSAKILRFLF
jgi:PIN domain nuclease of toxin-antitoxin system